MTDIEIREYEANYHDEIINITESAYRVIFEETNSNLIRIILQNNIPVGWFYFETPENSLYSGFVFIYVSPKHRRKGIGSLAYKEVEKSFLSIGCDWWSSFPECEAAEKFAMSVGFDFVNTNYELEHSGALPTLDMRGIRKCTIEDYPEVPNLWTKEYGRMHDSIGFPSSKKELSEEELQEEYNDFCNNVHNYFVLEEDGKIVGMGGLFSSNSGIGSLAVATEYSGKGYGTKLAIFLTNECIIRGNSHPYLSCEGGNENALYVYQKIGYTIKNKESVALHSRVK